MCRLLFQIAIVSTLLISPQPAALACKYSVRDVGFVDLESSPYRLIVAYSKETSAKRLQHMQEEVSAILKNTNVQAEWLEVQPGSETAELDRYLSRDSDKPLGAIPNGVAPAGIASSEAEVSQERRRASLPSLCLISPDDRRLTVHWMSPDVVDNLEYDQKSSAPSQETATLGELVRTLVDSPLRNQILTRLLASHSVILLIEGSDSAQNQTAAELAQQAVDRVTRSLPNLPKVIQNPPVVVTLSRAEALREKVLCWSLGLNPHREKTQIAVLFGRGRIIGVPLNFPETSLEDILLWQGYVGQDCECELDRAVMQGPMFPHRWDAQREAEAVKHLDFDPGSPLVKAEITRILQHGGQPGPRNLRVGIDNVDDSLSAYRNVAIEVAPSDDMKIRPSNNDKALANRQKPEKQNMVIESDISPLAIETQTQETGDLSKTSQSEQQTEQERKTKPPESDRTSSPWTIPVVSLGGLCFVAIAIGGWFLFRNSQGA